MAFRLSDLQAAASSVIDDIFHLRTTGGLDKKITLPNLRSSIMQNVNKGVMRVTLSNYDNTSAPDVKAGSVFDNAGTTVNVETSDATPTGYSGISNSTTFYLYWDDSAEAFIFDSTAPTWSDTLQGWYNGNDRALFSMYKDSGGTLYGNKQKLSSNGDVTLRTKVIELGDWNMDGLDVLVIYHGITDYTKIRTVSITIRGDGGTVLYPILGSYDDSGSPVGMGVDRLASDGSIILYRTTGGRFDSTSFQSTSFNRGWLTIMYEK